MRVLKGQEGIGSTIRMETPPKLMTLIKQGIELGVANDIIFGTTNSKQSNGHFGLMTKDVLTRQSCYSDAVVSALARFIHSHLFDN